MEIGECPMITEIVAGDDVAAKDEIVFRDLKELELCDLESQTSFCSGDCCFKFPSLERLAVDNCPNMKVFSRGELSTPKLHKLMLFRWDRQDWSCMIEEDGTHKAFEVYWTWKGNVNTTIQHLYQKRLEKEKEENDRSTKLTNAGGGE
ncbi:hypothetical protein KPL71_015523 [Citrus sinensis]|nr:hypothetical protein KPL71_015523 [Citrus sinensis]